MMDMTMGQRIAEQRKMLGISQEMLGEKMGVSRQAISKWEADGAVPEIDKLIALSRLFGVSVGWLLGTEEETFSNADNSFTEEQLKMVEEIIRRYQRTPEPEPSKRKKIWRRMLAICAGVVLLIAITTLIEISNEVQQHTHQITGVQSGYYNIQSALRLLSERLNELAEGEKLITDYEFQAAPFADWSGADVEFTTVPKAWREDDTAYLVVRLGGQEIYKARCTWDGSGCSAQLAMDAANGYELCYVVEHSDGTREQQVLDAHDVENLESSLSLECYMSVGTVTMGRENIEVEVYWLDIKLPVFYNVHEGEPELQSVQWVIYLNHTPVLRRTMVETEDLAGQGFNISGNGIEKLPMPQAKDGDVLEIGVEAVLTNGITGGAIASTWILTDGQWRAAG